MDPRRLPPFAVEAYDILRETAQVEEDDQEGMSFDAARAALDHVDDEFTTGDIDYILDLLHNRGEIYSVTDRIRFTDPDEFDQRYHDDE